MHLIRLFALAFVAVVGAARARAQSDERIRPVAELVFAAFPAADTVRHIVRDVDEAARRQIEARLPFQIHFEDLGEHRLHVAFRGQKPVGMMFVRSEQTNWGIADIGWAMTLEGRIVGFAFTNERSQEARELPRSVFARQLVGLDFRGLQALAAPPATASTPATPAGESRPERSQCPMSPTHRMILRSAMKATLVTELVWQDQIIALADLQMLLDALPGSRRGRRAVLPVTGDAAARSLRSGRVVEARGQKGTAVGQVARTRAHVRFETGPRDVELIWTIDPTGRVLRVRPVVSWAKDDLRRACAGLRGRPLEAPLMADNPLTQVARELAIALRTALPARLPAGLPR